MVNLDVVFRLIIRRLVCPVLRDVLDDSIRVLLARDPRNPVQVVAERRVTHPRAGSEAIYSHPFSPAIQDSRAMHHTFHALHRQMHPPPNLLLTQVPHMIRDPQLLS
jgi:hypothetical protein